MGWILVVIVGINVVMLAIYSAMKAASDYDDEHLGDRQYDEY